MNPIHVDFTLLSQVLSFLFILGFICLALYYFVFLRNKREKDKEFTEKLDRIIELLEKRNKP